MKFEYLVSVRLMTYNHSRFVKAAMDGIMSQITDFNFEIVVGDDFSTDETLQIIKEYKDSDKIHIKILKRMPGDIYQENRIKFGRLYNFTDIISNCNGKYIALLDGDDFWIDSRKLQKQIEFLENNNDYNICFHNARVVENENYNDKLYSDFAWCHINRNQDTYLISDLIKSPLMPSASLVFRNKGFLFDDWFYKVPGGDMALSILACGNGKVKYFDECWSAYRKHEAGVTSQHKGDWIHARRIYMYLRFLEFFGNTNREHIIEMILYHLNNLNDFKYLDLKDCFKLFSLFPGMYVKKKLRFSNYKEYTS